MSKILYWQCDTKSLKERISHFYLNKDTADVIFLVEGYSFPAHKWLLAATSFAFYNIFYLMKLDNDEIEIPDVSAKAFKTFLTYVYTDEIQNNGNLTLPIVSDVILLATRYEMNHLATLCASIYFKMKIFTTDYDIIETLKYGLMIESEQMQTTWRTYFERNLLMYMDNLSFLYSATDEIMDFIVNLPIIYGREVDIFTVLIKWSKYQCGKENVQCTNANMKNILGDKFYKIRFPTMDYDVFQMCLQQHRDLFLDRDIANIITSMNRNTGANGNQFIRVSRSMFKEIKISSASINKETYAKINYIFEATKTVKICGIVLTTSKVNSVDRGQCLSLKLYRNNNHRSKVKINYFRFLSIFDECLIFAQPITLTRYEKYTLALEFELNDWSHVNTFSPSEIEFDNIVVRIYKSGGPIKSLLFNNSIEK